MKRLRDGCATTSRQSARQPTRRRRSKFARLQLCLFLCWMPIGTPSAELLRRRRTKEKQYEVYKNEPSFGEQFWIFEPIKIRGAWNLGYTGENVRVRINDESWEYNHAEWIGGDRLIDNNANAQYDYSCGDPNNKLQWEETISSITTNSTNATNSTNTSNITNTITALNHGAAVTSILAANGTNEFCGVGIAPRSKLSFCNFKEDTTDAKVLIHNIKPQNRTAEVLMNRTSSFDISLNAFAYEGCTSESRRKITGLYQPDISSQKNSSRYGEEPKTQNNSTRLLEQTARNLRACPFIKFYNDSNNEADDPCQVCTNSDFEFVNVDSKRDNVFETASIADSTSKNSDGNEDGEKAYSETVGHNGVSEDCASSVRAYCLHNFRRDEALCTKWIEVINRGNMCSFKSNVGKEVHHSLETGVKEGRNGLGVVYIFPSGDSYGNGDNVNYQAFPKSRFVMTVGAVKMRNITGGPNGSYLQPIHSTYSTGGSSVFVVAPGGDYDSPHQHVGAGGETSCGEIGYGTSFAAPVVGGVVALMLEAYPNATWRDIRAIVAETSKPVEILDILGKNDDETFEINAVGIGYSDLYGFGLVNARHAVQKARNWNRKGKHVPPEVGITERSGEVNLDIDDDSYSTTTNTIMLYDERFDTDSASLESVSVYLKLRYFNRGHLRITLRSPSGTTSLLSPGGRNEYGQLNCGEWWEFLTLRSWGENPNGIWKLSITDTKPGSGDVKCIDRPAFSVPAEATKLGVSMTCYDYESEGLCMDGTTMQLQNKTLNAALFEEEHGDCGMTATSACCACGGGIKPDDDDVLYSQLEEWKIVLGAGSPAAGIQPVNFYDEEFWDKDEVKINYNESAASNNEEKEITVSPTVAPTEKQKPPTLPPTFKEIKVKDLPDPNEEIEGFQGVMTGIKNFFSNIFGGSDIDGEGEDSGSKASSVVAWIITFGFSILLLMRGSSLCDFHVNFSRDSRDRDRRHRR